MVDLRGRQTALKAAGNSALARVCAAFRDFCGRPRIAAENGWTWTHNPLVVGSSPTRPTNERGSMRQVWTACCYKLVAIQVAMDWITRLPLYFPSSSKT